MAVCSQSSKLFCDIARIVEVRYSLEQKYRTPHVSLWFDVIAEENIHLQKWNVGIRLCSTIQNSKQAKFVFYSGK